MLKKQVQLKYLCQLRDHMNHYNSIGPFPSYDTDYVKDIENKIKQIEMNIDHDYDKDSVVACKYCKSLHIINDEYDNSYCQRCGSVNELIEFNDIFEYKKFTEKKVDD